MFWLLGLTLTILSIFREGKIANNWGAPAAAAISLAGRDYKQFHPNPHPQRHVAFLMDVLAVFVTQA